MKNRNALRNGESGITALTKGPKRKAQTAQNRNINRRPKMLFEIPRQQKLHVQSHHYVEQKHLPARPHASPRRVAPRFFCALFVAFHSSAACFRASVFSSLFPILHEAEMV